jgi:outer membrane protein OmpA-like peptidoglycan-associated protein
MFCKSLIPGIIGCFLSMTSLAQQYALEGYVYESNNRGYLNQVQIAAYRLSDQSLQAETNTNQEGYFLCYLPEGTYRVIAFKDIFFEKADTIQIGGEKSFLKIELRRRPGYLFDATIAEARESPDQIVDAVSGASIEIYNRTTRQLEWSEKDAPDAFFSFTFERGNHYTLLIRKEGFLTKRIEVYVNINGCIICVDGVRDVAPGVVDNLAAGHAEGTLLANIELERARIDKRIQIQHIYYDYDKWDIRPDAAERLDNVVVLMKDNPEIAVELGSHTDSRGNDDYNQQLSQRRAAAAVAYIISEGIDSARITARGYGESQLVNRCRNGVECSEDEHQQNRRTELRITGISEKKTWKSLPQIIEEEEFERAQKSKKQSARPRFQEANTSVPLPAFTPAPAPVTTPEESDLRILPVEGNFKGFAVEIARSAVELPADDAAFAGLKEVFRLLEDDGKFTYLLANLGARESATQFYNKKIKPRYPAARLVLFTDNGKEYLDTKK